MNSSQVLLFSDHVPRVGKGMVHASTVTRTSLEPVVRVEVFSRPGYTQLVETVGIPAFTPEKYKV